MLQPALVSTGTTSLAKLTGRSAACATSPGQARLKTPARVMIHDHSTDDCRRRLITGGILFPLRCQGKGRRSQVGGETLWREGDLKRGNRLSYSGLVRFLSGSVSLRFERQATLIWENVPGTPSFSP